MATSAVTATAEEMDRFSAAVADAYFPHQLEVLKGARTYADLRSVDLGQVRLARIGWGSEVSVESDHPGAWAVNVPRSGVLEARVRGHQVVSLDGQATICPPDQATRMSRWSSDCSIVGMRIERDYLADQAAAVLGLSSEYLPAQLDLAAAAGQAWLGLLTSIGGEALRNPVLVRDRVVSERLAATLTAAFLVACFPEEPECGTVRPRIVTRVLDAMEDDPAREWNASELARVAGVGVRRLQQGFRKYAGATPTQVLQRIRLERVHADLLAGRGESVAEVAYRWGFNHLGRFAAAYRHTYGVPPSQTLRASSRP